MGRLAYGGFSTGAGGAGDDSHTGTLPLMACDAGVAFNVACVGRGHYCLTVAVPGFDAHDIDVSTDGGCLRITGRSRLPGSDGEVLHRGLDDGLDCTFLMLRPLEVVAVDVRWGLLRIDLREPPGTGVRAALPPRLDALEALALAA